MAVVDKRKQMSRRLELNMGGDMKDKGRMLEAPGSRDDNEQEDPELVKEEHGAATDIHIHHDHEAGHHTVDSEHPDGHQHHSEHDSAEEAHDHARKLADAGGEPEHEDDANGMDGVQEDY